MALTAGAVLFDLDGVLTDTAALHERAWARLLEEYFAELGHHPAPAPFSAADYRRFVDGRPRVVGLVNMLASRGLAVPSGGPGDGPEKRTVHGLAERKDRYFRALIETEVPVFPATRTVLERLHGFRVPVAVVSASRHAAGVLARSGLARWVSVLVDGREAERLGLPGKPDPATFLLAAHRLGIPPRRAAVVEDAVAGVVAGRRGAFGVVVGVDRHDDAAALTEAGTDVVVTDLAELGLTDVPGGVRISGRPVRA